MTGVFDNFVGVTRGQLEAGDVPIPASAITGLTSWWPSLAISSLDFRNSRFMVRGAATVNFADVVTATRSGDGTYFDADGVLQTVSTDVMRYPVYDPATDTNLGLLAEPAATNILLRSQEFGTTWAATAASISANAVAAPDGTTTADKLIDTAVNTTHFISQTISLTAGDVICRSIFVKAGEITALRLATGSPNLLPVARYDLSAVTATGVSGHTAVGIEDVGDGWYRCWVTGTASATGSYAFLVLLEKPAGTMTYTGNGTDGLYIWGAQLEKNGRPTSYVPTTSAEATRGADVATVTNLYGVAATANRSFAGVVAGRTGQALPAASSAYTIYQIDDGSEDNRVRVEWYNNAGTGELRLVVTSGGVAQTAPLVVGNLAVDTDFKVAYSVEDNDVLASLDGATAVTDTSATSPSGLTTARIGRSFTGEYWGGTIKEITNFRTLSAAEAEVLSV